MKTLSRFPRNPKGSHLLPQIALRNRAPLPWKSNRASLSPIQHSKGVWFLTFVNLFLIHPPRNTISNLSKSPFWLSNRLSRWCLFRCRGEGSESFKHAEVHPISVGGRWMADIKHGTSAEKLGFAANSKRKKTVVLCGSAFSGCQGIGGVPVVFKTTEVVGVQPDVAAAPLPNEQGTKAKAPTKEAIADPKKTSNDDPKEKNECFIAPLPPTLENDEFIEAMGDLEEFLENDNLMDEDLLATKEGEDAMAEFEDELLEVSPQSQDMLTAKSASGSENYNNPKGQLACTMSNSYSLKRKGDKDGGDDTTSSYLKRSKTK